MNKFEGVGRLTRNPEIRESQGSNQTTIAKFTVAINRKFKNSDGEYEADFIGCIAFGKTAEFIKKYFTKGMAIGIVGRIQTGSFVNKDGNKVYTTDVVVEEAEFVEKKGSNNDSETSTNSNKSNNDFMNIPDAADEELPFN